MPSADYPHLLSPLTVGPREIRNRLLVTAHVPRLADDGVPGERYVAYHRERARGGVGMQITGATPVHPSGGHGDGGALENIDDRIIDGYRLLADAVHAEGGCILAQLAHYGATIPGDHADAPPWSPSAQAAELVRVTPHVMTVAEIQEVVTAFGAAAKRVREGGLDGVEILGAFGLLIAAFMSPYSNKRTDEYGGSLDNRLRFAFEVIDAVRDAAGPARIVGMRIPGDEFVEGGLDNEAMQEIAGRLESTGKLDYLNVAAGNNLDRIHRTTHWPPTPAPHGLFVPLASAIRKVVSLPVFTVGRIVDPAHAERILAEGHADMVGMTRASIADPRIVRKLEAGRGDDIRRCVGANVCIARVLTGAPVRCIQNPTAGREHEWGAAVATKRPKNVAVIGGGPAGLEAARVAAERGHRVTLFERDVVLGGQFALRAAIPTWREFQHIIDWRRSQVEKLQVHLELERNVTADDIVGLGADAVVLATGAEPVRAAIDGESNSSIVVSSPHEVMRTAYPDARVALVWDEAGGVIAPGVIEWLVAQGLRVKVVTPAFAVAEDIDLIQRVPLYERLLSAGVEFMPNHIVTRLDGGTVVTQNVYTLEESPIETVDLLVPSVGRTATDELQAPIERAGIEVHLAGDCSAPRTADIAIAEGALAARNI